MSRLILRVLLIAVPALLAGADRAQNVILFLGDAGGMATLNAASIHEYREPRRLFIHKMPHIALSETSSASSWVTDSAAGMTAIVTGAKTRNGVISQSASAIRGKQDGETLKSVLEYAEEFGLSTGVISNSSVLSATPAACYAHVNDRKNVAGVLRDLLKPRFGDGVDVVFGAGRKDMLEAATEFGSDIASLMTKAGYAWHDSLEAVPADARRASVVFARNDFDLNAATQRAIDILSRNPKGFFLMVESDLHTENIVQGLERAVALDSVIRRTAERMAGTGTLILFTADHSYDFRVHDGDRGRPLFQDPGRSAPVGDEQTVRWRNLRRDDDHTGEEVLVAAQGAGAERVGGILANTDLFHIMMAAYGWTEPADVRAALATEPVGDDPDDPAIWVNRTDPSRSLILGTNKTAAPAGAVVVFGLDGRIRQKVTGLDRPNNVDIEYSLRLQGRPADIAVVTERYKRRLRAFRIAPDGSGISDVSGDLGVFAGIEGEAGAPMGIALYNRPRDGAIFAIVAPKTGPREGYLAQYRLEDDGSGRVRATLVRRFGRFSGAGEIEAVAVDDALGYVYYADEGDGIHKYHADPDHPDAALELAHFGQSGFAGDREGIAIYARPDGTGYVVCTDQVEGNSRYHLYRREGAQGRPHDHSEPLKSFRGGADSTDGIEVVSAALGQQFPGGLMVAMNSGPRNFLFFRWDDVAAANGRRSAEPSAPRAQLPREDARARLKAVQAMMRPFDKSKLDLLIDLADTDPDAAVRKAIVERLGRRPEPAVAAMLERRALSDADTEISVLALERLRLHQAERLGKLFDQRLAAARAGGDAGSVSVLVAESQRWRSHARGATLPAFLQQAPPLFDALPLRQSVRALAFGDFGTGNADMKKTAIAAAAYHCAQPFDLGLTLGDNVLSNGVTGTADPRWKEVWEDLYAPLGIPVFAVTGNHDWGYSDSPAAEILYSSRSETWRMPALYYTYTAGPIQFFALATNAMSEAQLAWLDRELKNSTARWKVVYGHHPIYSHGSHGDTHGFDRTLLPVLKDRAHAYLVGHEHTPQHLKPEQGVHLFIAPAAGQGKRPAANGSRTLYTGSFHGFTVIDANRDTLTFRFIDSDGNMQYETTLK